MKNAPPVAAILTRTTAASHSIFKGLGAIQGPLFMPMGWCPRPVSQTPSRPRNGSPRRESCSVVRHLFRRRMCGKRQCSRRNMRQMLTRPGRGEGSAPGYAPGCGVRVMGCARGRGRGENGYRITLWSAGALPGKILHELPGMCCIIPARIRETVRRFCKLLAQPGRVRPRRDRCRFSGRDQRPAPDGAYKSHAEQDLGAGGLCLAAQVRWGPHRIEDWMGETGGTM